MPYTQNIELVYPAERKTTGAGKNTDGKARRAAEARAPYISFWLGYWPARKR